MIELLIINSLIIWGIYASLQEGFIFGKVGNWIRGNHMVDNEKKFFDDPFTKDNLPSWIKKPLATCPICMASIYGTIGYLALYDNYTIITYICHILAIAGLQYLILTFMPE